MRSKPHKANRPAPPLRHVISINDLTNAEIEAIFETAKDYLERLPDPSAPYRIGRSMDAASDFILATLFYEPSTRTRLSFESAMLRLGGRVITSADPLTSSAAKGETLADTVRVIGNYADVIVLRHNRDGAARLAAEYSPVPVVNGGDGSHEHPTQTLCDLFTLRQKHGNLKDLNVAISGDLKGSRTIHSFVYALARFGSNILMMPAKGMELPSHVDRRLREEFRCVPVPRARYEQENAAIDALYVTPDEPHQLSLISDLDAAATVKLNKLKKVHAMYVTRFQKERWSGQQKDYLKVDAQFLKSPKYAETSLLHPLPRVNELDASLDQDERAMYFQQAAYGVPIRMALLAGLLGVAGSRHLKRYEHGFADEEFPLYDQPIGTGLRCPNNNCITREESEQQYVRNKFSVVAIPKTGACKLRCHYCEADVDDFVVGDAKKGHYTAEPAQILALLREGARSVIAYADEADARRGGLRPKDPSRTRRTKGPSAA